MPRRSLRCVAEISIHAVSCPGVWMPRRDDVYFTISMFGQHRRTQLSGPSFPLLFHEKFRFDKVFYTAFEPSQVADRLLDENVYIELVQLTPLSASGRLLARYETSVRNFLYPYPTYSATYGTQDRDVLMERTIDFPGISPKLQFSTKTTIKESNVPVYDSYDPNLFEDDPLSTPRRSRSRARSRSPGKRYSQPTLSSVFRSRSMSPGLSRQLDALDLRDEPHYDNERPPFVIRKVDSHALIGRSPGIRPKLRQVTKMRRRPGSAGRPGYYTDDDYYLESTRPTYYSKVVREPSYYTRGYDSDSEDDEVADLTRYRSTSPVLTRTRARPVSPLDYRTSLTDRGLTTSASLNLASKNRSVGFNTRPWSPTYSDLISERVDRALYRNRSLDRLTSRSRSPYRYGSYW